MKIVLFGEDLYSATVVKSLIHNGHEIMMIIAPFYEKDNSYKILQKTAEKYNILFTREININCLTIKNKLVKLKTDLIICVHLKKILKKEIFSLSKHGAINVHPSLLPKYKGLSPLNQAIIHGDSTTAVTLHFINESIDSGKIIIQEIFPISTNDYIYDLLVKILSIYKYIFLKAIELIEDINFKPIKQEEVNSSYFGNLTDKDREINLNSSISEVYNQIRALSMPFKGAYYKDFIIWRASFTSKQKEALLIKKYPIPDIYFNKENDNLILRLKDGILISHDFEIYNSLKRN